ncbi:MAG: flagellar export protein FliJ [Desulfohalobiaceae bacterium]
MPQQFYFPLQQLLDLRKMQEEKAALKLAREKMRMEAKSKELWQLQQDLETVEKRETDKKNTYAWELWLWLRYRERLLQDLDQVQIKLEEQMQKVQECREDLASKSQELKKMERLKEKQALEHKQRQDQKEQKELDEMAALLYQKRDI